MKLERTLDKVRLVKEIARERIGVVRAVTRVPDKRRKLLAKARANDVD